jgi:transketolase
MDTFADQDEAYRDSVCLPRCGTGGGRGRVVVRLAPLGGELGEIQAMEHFGASAPAGKLFDRFGFTPEAVAEKARRSLERAGRANG